MVLSSCASTDDKPKTAPSVPPMGPSSAKVDEAVAYVREGLPFPVEIDPCGAIFDSPISTSELVHLKRNFLVPLAGSSHADRISKVTIDASALEWLQWTCRIDLKDYMSPISITHFAGLYDGKTNTDPDGYRKSRPYVLGQLDNIAKRVGWQNQPGEQASGGDGGQRL
ncbi:MAG: hypothetical protein H7A48_01245 [Akkermansiaceae bacterium]|nr:hypothetical protein [Akkermansiaceae bacterium]MCP5546242.1 hypothetical protein [Akkermansiaceae bacterium]